MTIKPLLDRVVLKVDNAEQTTASGIVLSTAAQEKPQFANVIAVGPGGVVDGKETSLSELKELASVPSRDGLLTMLAGGMIGIVRDLSICLDLYSQQKEEN